MFVCAAFFVVIMMYLRMKFVAFDSAAVLIVKILAASSFQIVGAQTKKKPTCHR